MTLLSLIREFELIPTRRDVYFWSPNSTAGFSCSLFFSCLMNPSLTIESILLILWKMKIPMKVQFFVVIHRRVTSLIGYFDRVVLLHSLSKGRGSLDHILWSYDFARFVWSLFFDVFGY